MDPAMAVLACVKPGAGQRAGEGRLSWPVFLLTLAAVTSSSLSALSLYKLIALRAEVEGLKSEVYRRREEGQEAKHGGQVRENSYQGHKHPHLHWVANTCKIYFTCIYLVAKDCIVSLQTENIGSRRSSQVPLHQPESQHAFTHMRRKRMVTGTETSGKTQYCTPELDSLLLKRCSYYLQKFVIQTFALKSKEKVKQNICVLNRLTTKYEGIISFGVHHVKNKSVAPTELMSVNMLTIWLRNFILGHQCLYCW